MGNYDNIQIPVPGQPISSSLYGIRVRDAIIAMDARLSRVESTLSNYAFKAGTTTRTATTTLADDPDLKMWCEANSTYFVEFFLTVAASTTEDIKTAWTVPASVTTTTRRVFGPGSNSSDAGADNIAMRAGTHLYAGAVLYSGVRNLLTLQFQIQGVGLVKTAGVAGYTTLQWAQNTSGATGTTVNNESFCRATKIA